MTKLLFAFVYFLACFGLSWIIVESKITYSIRYLFYLKKSESKIYSFLYELTKCLVCTSFWVTLFTLITPYPYYLFNYPNLWMYLYLPFAISGLMIWWLEFTGELNE